MHFDLKHLLTLQAIALDVDGVLTDGTLTWSESGEESKTFSFTDIMGLSLARRLGLTMALISGENSPLVDRYAKKLHIPFVVKGTRDKATALGDFAAKFKIPFQDIAFFGDDVNDLPAMQIAGLPCCPSNAASDVIAYVQKRGFVAGCPGGRGAVRDLVDLILKERDLDGLEVFHRRPPE